jgi:glutaminyl-peptide cyclotransferase
MYKFLQKVHQSLVSQSTRRGSAMLSMVVALPILFAACPTNESPARPTPSNSQPAPSPAPSGAATFSAERAMDHVKKQMDFGPRPPGSAELAKTRAYIVEQLTSSGLKVTNDEFRVPTPLGEKNMVNITAEIPGESKEVIMLSSHYDSKYYKDKHFLGANDPGASVAELVELGRVLATNNPKPKFTYWLTFFDGEEAFCSSWDECSKPGAPDNTYGSRHFVEKLKKANETSRVRAMILFDMMGYKNLELGRDTLSTRWLQNIVWQTGRELGYGNIFVDREEGVGGDDHEPFLGAGIDSLDIIQLNSYEYWHTEQDTIDKVSGKSLKIVGDTILASLPKIEQYLTAHPR